MSFYCRMAILMAVACVVCSSGQAAASVVSGHVVDGAGIPIAGAIVYVSTARDLKDTVKATTDANGDFSLDINIPNNERPAALCAVTAKGFAPGGTNFDDDDNVLVTLEPPVEISGTVVDEKNQPVPNISVGAYGAHEGKQPIITPDDKTQTVNFALLPNSSDYRTTTDSHGAYTISNVPAEMCVGVAVSDPRYLQAYTTTEIGSVIAPPIVLHPAASVKGKVVHDDGSPVGAMSVAAVGQIDGHFSMSTGQVLSDGTYTIGSLKPGTYTVELMPDFASQSRSEWIDLNPLKITATMETPAILPDILLTRGVPVSGTVLDVDTHLPIRNVEVGFNDPTITGCNFRFTSATTDASGIYTAYTWPGSVSVQIESTPDGYSAIDGVEQTKMQTVVGKTTTVAPLFVKPSFTVTGNVVDGNGNCVPGLKLRLKPTAIYLWQYLRAVKASQTGSFTFRGLLPGSYIIDSGSEWSVVSPKALIIAGDQVTNIVVAKTAILPLKGMVIDPSGKPIANAMLSFDSAYSVSDGSMIGEIKPALSGQDGTFTIDMPHDTSNVALDEVSKDGYLRQGSGLISTANGQLSITPIVMAQLGGTITGVVRVAHDEPVAGAWVACLQQPRGDASIQTDVSGRFKMSGVAVGNLDIYAAKGRYCGHKVVHSTTSGTDTTIYLDPMSHAPSSHDAQTAMQMMATLCAPTNNGDRWAQEDVRETSIAEIASLNLDAALTFAASDKQTPGPQTIADIVQARTSVNPESAALWLVSHLALFGNGEEMHNSAALTGLAVARTDPNTATILYKVATSAFNQGSRDQDIDCETSITALAYALGRPEASQLYAKTVASMNTYIANDRTPPGSYPATKWMPRQFVRVIAMGSSSKARQYLATMSAEDRAESLPDVVRALVQSNPGAAFTLLDSFGNMSTGSEYWAYNQAVRCVLPLICQSNPAHAIQITRAIADPEDAAKALVIVADNAPMPRAVSLYREAEAKSAGNGGQVCTPALIAAHAFLRDSSLGAELYKQAYDKVIEKVNRTDPYEFGYDAQFAYYYSRFDPGFARILVERQFANDQIDADSRTNDLVDDVAAMTAIDIDRAGDMALSIKNDTQRYRARFKVAQYIDTSQNVRDTMPFDWWIQDESWIPGTPAPE